MHRAPHFFKRLRTSTVVKTENYQKVEHLFKLANKALTLLATHPCFPLSRGPTLKDVRLGEAYSVSPALLWQLQICPFLQQGVRLSYLSTLKMQS